MRLQASTGFPQPLKVIRPPPHQELESPQSSGSPEIRPSQVAKNTVESYRLSSASNQQALFEDYCFYKKDQSELFALLR